MLYTMIVELASGSPRYIEFDKFPISIGRSPSCDIEINDPGISQTHAVISKGFGKKLTLKDKGSSTGVFINSQKIKKSAINFGEAFYLGEVKCLFCETERLNDYKVDYQEYLPRHWYFVQNGVTKGPYKSKEFKALALKGIIEPDTEIIFEGERSVAKNIDGIVFLKEIDAATTRTNLATKTSHIESYGEILCPHCWWRFDYEQILYISEHPDLRGDPVRGEEAQKRFLPDKFTSTGKAVDLKGLPCADMACPKCHVYIPKVALKNNNQMIFSIVGVPSSGKSFLLTAMIYKLRQLMPTKFNISLMDSDPKANAVIHDYEHTFFFSDPEKLVSLRKTEEQGELYNQVIFDGVVLHLPAPMFFQMKPMGVEENDQQMTKTLVLYDNAGESFQPGKDTANNPATLHLGHSNAVFYLYDPLQDPKFKSMISQFNNEQVLKSASSYRQEILIDEIINRIEKHTHSTRPLEKQMIVLITKYDLWKGLLNVKLDSHPWEESKEGCCVLNMDKIYTASLALRNLFEEACPQAVHAIEENFQNVLFLPISAIGENTTMHENENGIFGVKPKEIDPFWTSVPLLKIFADEGYIKTVTNKEDSAEVEAFPLQKKFKVTVEGNSYILPGSYLNRNLICPKSNTPFRPVSKQSDSNSEEKGSDLNSLIESL